MSVCAREIPTVVRQPCPVYLFSQTSELTGGNGLNNGIYEYDLGAWDNLGNKFGEITTDQHAILVNSARAALLTIMNHERASDGGAFVNNKRKFAVVGPRQLSHSGSGGNSQLAQEWGDAVFGSKNYTIAGISVFGPGAVLTREDVTSFAKKSARLKAPIFASTSNYRFNGSRNVVVIAETYRISGGPGGQSTCVNTSTGAACF